MAEKRIIYMDPASILLIHFIVMDGYFIDYERDVTQEQAGVKDVNLLLSALHMPQHTYEAKELYPGVLMKAAVLMRSLIKNHAFFNGNKRTAVLATIVFLEMNSFNVVAEESKMFRLAMWVVYSKPLITVEKIARSLKKFTKEAVDKRGRRAILDNMVSKTTDNAINKFIDFLKKISS